MPFIHHRIIDLIAVSRAIAHARTWQLKSTEPRFMAAITLDVPPFLLEPDATDCGIHALRSVLAALDRDVDYDTLKAVSGDGFKFAYDRGAIFEPMRDLTPTDFMRDGLACYGVRGAWQTSYTLEDLDALLPAALEKRHPVLTSNLLDASGGYQIIVGYEPGDVPRIAVRGGLLASDLEEDPTPGRPPRWIPLDADWHGPVTSRARWGANPVFLIEHVDDAGEPSAQPSPDLVLRRAAEAGMRACEVFEIAYGTSGLEQDFASEPLAGRSAAHGAEAWAVFIEEIRQRPSLEHSAFIWKVDTVAARLAHDRDALARFFAACADRVDGSERGLLTGLAADLRQLACDARDLRQLVWFDPSSAASSAEAVQDMLSSSRALAYPLPDDEGLVDALRAIGYDDRVAELTRGNAILMQDEMRWREVLRHVQRMADREANVEAALPRLAAG